MIRLENYRPVLRPGRIIPQNGKIVYETEKPFDQVVLPIEMTDFLVLCNGNFTVAEIVENIYHRKGTVQFKSIIRSLQYLNDRGFLENGHDLDLQDPHESESLVFHSLRPDWSLPIGRRIFNEQEHHTFFYVASMGILITSILSFQNVGLSWMRGEFFKLDGSYIFGALFFVALSGLLLSFKNVMKTLMQVFLTGRAYNFGLIFNGYTFHFTVSADALFLTNNSLYLALYHLASYLSPLPMAGLMAFFWPDFPLMHNLFQVVMILLLLEANPFEENDISQLVRTLFPDDTFKRLLSAEKSKQAEQLLSFAGTKAEKNLATAFNHFSLLWVAAMLCTVATSGYFLFNDAVDTMRTADVGNRMAAFLVMTLIGTWGALAFVNGLKLLKFNFVAPLRNKILNFRKKRNVRKIDVFNQNQVVTALEDLPLFSYFPKELLNMLVQKSVVTKYPSGTSVIVQGDEGRELFVLLTGRLEVRKKYGKSRFSVISEILPTSIFGEIAVLQDCRRMADIVAKEDSVALSVPAHILRQAATENRYIRELESFKNAIMVSQFFASAPLFRSLDDSLVHLFTARGKIETFQRGSFIFKQGDPGDGFYLVLRGQVGVAVNGRPIARIHQGGFFGEISLIADTPRTGSINAMDDTVVLKIGRESFWDILARDLRLAIIIETVGEFRIREDIEILRGKDAKIA